jgi:hypothetical protein
MRFGALLLAAGLLAGCAGSGEDTAAKFLVAPGKYVLYDCTQIEQAMKGIRIQQEKLEKLTAKAGSDAVGRTISTAAYEPQLLQLRGNMADLRRTAAEKNCKPTPNAEQSPAPANASPKPKQRRPVRGLGGAGATR